MPCNHVFAAARRGAAQAVLCAVAMLSATALHAETVVLRGTVGAYPVVMEFDTDDESAYGRYFYERYRQDILLRGEPAEAGYRLRSAHYEDDEGNEDEFVLSRDGEGFSGTFRHGKARPLAVKLAPVASGSVPDPRPDLTFERPLSDYERLRLAGIRLVPGKEETTGNGYRIRWISEPLSGISMFHVIDGYSEMAMAAINRIIDRDLYNNLSQHFSCADGNGGSGEEGTGITSHYLDERLVSYAVSSSWSCFGSAHPDFGIRGTTIDASTGHEFTLDDVFRPGGAEPPAHDSGEWGTYRREVFAPAVVPLFQQLYPAQMQHDEGDCDYTDPSVWEYPSWYVTAEGLYLGAYFARAARPCDNPDWSLVPSTRLEGNSPASTGP